MAQATNRMNKTDKAANRPIHTIRYGAVRAAIWRNMIDAGNNSRPVYNVTFTRSYKDGDQWRESASFGLDELLLLAKAANDAHSYICGQRRGD